MLHIVGLGPGHVSLLTPQARAAIEGARVLVGYTRYLELIPEAWKEGKELVATGMTKEIDRCRRAVDSAAQGKETAVVCSGDPGVYALASLVLELAHEQGLDTDIQVVPGIPALCAAAALLGAPLTHDFAVISLSDLLTPWELIEKRLSLAAQGDFVLAIYNPRSKRRDWQLDRARELLLEHLAPETVVGVVRQAHRQEQETRTTTLAGLETPSVDMLSIVLVGNSQTRILNGRMVTPRGYFGKYDASGQEMERG